MMIRPAFAGYNRISSETNYFVIYYTNGKEEAQSVAEKALAQKALGDYRFTAGQLANTIDEGLFQTQGGWAVAVSRKAITDETTLKQKLDLQA